MRVPMLPAGRSGGPRGTPVAGAGDRQARHDRAARLARRDPRPIDAAMFDLGGVVHAQRRPDDLARAASPAWTRPSSCPS